MSEFLVKGAVTELVVPFDKDEKLDLGRYALECEYQLKSGIKGLFCNGIAGETFYLSDDEKVAVTKVAVEKANGKVPVIGNICTFRYADAQNLLKRFEEAGVDAICVTQPSVVGYTPDLLFKYYSDLAHSTKLPVYVYNAPQTNNTMSPELVDRIVNENENIVGYKDSTQNIIHLQTVLAGIGKGKHFECISGSDATIYPTLAVGGCGIISLISAVFPQPVINVCDRFFNGDIQGSFEAQKYVLAIRTALKAAPFVAGYKYAASLIGLDLGTVRNPLVEASDAQKVKLKENLINLGLVN